MKLDDDNFFIKELISRQIEKVRNISQLTSNFYFFYWGLNIYEKNHLLWIVNSNSYSWYYWDIWFFKLSKKTYFIQDKYSEKLITPYFHFNLWFSYLHFKYIKQNNGLNYAPEFLRKYFTKLLEVTEISQIENYTKYLTSLELKEIYDNVISPNNS